MKLRTYSRIMWNRESYNPAWHWGSGGFMERFFSSCLDNGCANTIRAINLRYYYYYSTISASTYTWVYRRENKMRHWIWMYIGGCLLLFFFFSSIADNDDDNEEWEMWKIRNKKNSGKSKKGEKKKEILCVSRWRERCDMLSYISWILLQSLFSSPFFSL